MKPKRDQRIIDLDRQLAAAKKVGDFHLKRKLLRKVSGTLGGIARQANQAEHIAERNTLVCKMWAELGPRPDDLFLSQADQCDVFHTIADYFGLTTDHVREITATMRVTSK